MTCIKEYKLQMLPNHPVQSTFVLCKLLNDTWSSSTKRFQAYTFFSHVLSGNQTVKVAEVKKWKKGESELRCSDVCL